MSATLDCTRPGFKARVSQYFAAATAAAKTWYDADGNWVAPSKPAETRERLWLCFALYAAGARRLADAVIRKGESPQYAQGKYNIFDTNIAVALLVQHRGKMAADVRAKLEGLARDGFNFRPGNRQPDYQFHGYNDNMPAKATMGLVLGGELLKAPDAVEYGLWDLRQLRAMLVRCGTNSEYNSPTYSPLTIHAMAEIAENAENPEARRIALAIETRLWIDLAARFHPETGVLAGPYSRAYTVDTLASTSGAAALLWFVLGDAARPSPLHFFDPPADLVVHHMGDYPFNIVQMCWFAGGHYHVPALAKRLFAGKSYPFTAIATAEQGDAGPDFPGRVARLHTYQQADFTVATATTSMCGGEQTLSYFVTYRRADPVASFRDVGTIYTKLVLNDDLPGAEAAAKDQAPAGAEMKPDAQPTAPKTYVNSGEVDMVASRANTLTLQDGPTALVLTHPHLALGGPDGSGIIAGTKATPIRRLSEIVVFPSHFGAADEIVVGGEVRTAWAGPVPHGAWVVCRRGRLLIGIRPLAYTRALGEVKLSLEANAKYQFIRAVFYEGAERTFARDELRHIFGGFVAEHASVAEFGSAAAFAAVLAATKFTDYYWTTRRVRYRRPAGAVRPAVEFEVSQSPGTQLTRTAAINGRAVAWPAVEIDGIKPRQLPFLNEPFQSVPSFFPWQDFRVEWGEWPYAISDREE